uniref:G protein-coupled receptor n=2 Tax=Panagrolaimus superbus TaxID=310955 RepID=A0A914YQM7_9BILA
MMMNVTQEHSYWMPLKTILHISDWFSGILALCANFFLIFLIITKTTNELKVYSRILIQSCLVDITFAVITLITNSQIDFNGGIILMTMTGPFRHQPNPITFHMINIYIVGLFSCVMFLPIPFIFRYFAVCKSRVLTAFEYAFLILLCFTISILYTCLHAWTFWPRGDLTKYSYIIDHPFWKDEDGTLPNFVAADFKDGRLFILVSCTMILGTISYLLIIAFNVLIYRKLTSLKSTMSAKTCEVHRQLSKVLKYQAMVPFFICVMPLSLVFLLSAIGTKTDGKGVILTMLVSYLPVMNSLSTILFVRQYRRTITQTRLFRIFCPNRAIQDRTSVERTSYIKDIRSMMSRSPL